MVHSAAMSSLRDCQSDGSKFNHGFAPSLDNIARGSVRQDGRCGFEAVGHCEIRALAVADVEITAMGVVAPFVNLAKTQGLSYGCVVGGGVQASCRVTGGSLEAESDESTG